MKKEAVYSAEELAKSANEVFGEKMRSECVKAALKLSGKTSATLAEAKEIVNKFMRKEIK